MASITLGAMSTSGCLERFPALGRNHSSSVDLPPASTPDYRTWIPAPTALPDGLDLNPSQVVHATPRESEQSDVGALFAFPERLVTAKVDWFGYDYAHYNRAIVIDSVIVLEGEIEPSVVESALSNTAYERTGTYEGYDLYSRSDLHQAVAVRDDSIVWSSGENGEQGVTAVIDAHEDRVESYHETAENFDRLTTASGGRPFNWLTPPEEDVAEAISTTYDDDYVYRVHHRLYSDKSSISEDELREEFESSAEPTDRRAFDIRSDGRLATVIQTYDRDSYLDATSSYDFPQVTWGVEHDNSANRVTIRHEAGDPVDATSLRITYWSPEETNPSETQFADEHETVEPGDELTVDPLVHETAKNVRLIYRRDEESTWLLFDYRLS